MYHIILTKNTQKCMILWNDANVLMHLLPKVHNPYRGKYPLEEILMGMHPAYPPHRLRKKLFAD